MMFTSPPTFWLLELQRWSRRPGRPAGKPRACAAAACALSLEPLLPGRPGTEAWARPAHTGLLGCRQLRPPEQNQAAHRSLVEEPQRKTGGPSLGGEWKQTPPRLYPPTAGTADVGECGGNNTAAPARWPDGQSGSLQLLKILADRITDRFVTA